MEVGSEIRCLSKGIGKGRLLLHPFANLGSIAKIEKMKIQQQQYKANNKQKRGSILEVA